MDLLTILEKTVSPGKGDFQANLCSHFSKKNTRHFCDDFVNFANISSFLVTDKTELETAQKFLEHAAQENLVSIWILVNTLRRT